MKVTKYKNNERKATWYTYKELSREGKMISLDGVSRGEPEYHKTIRQEFKDLDKYLDIDNMEYLVHYLNKEVEIDYNDRGFEVPYDTSREYLIVFNDKIMIYLYMTDEYMGMGESSTYAHLESILVPDGTDIEEVREVKEWLVNGGFEKLR